MPGNHDADVIPADDRKFATLPAETCWQHAFDPQAIGRPMTDGLNPADASLPPAKRQMFAVLAAILAVIGALAAGYYFSMRPVILRIAVGPTNSDDIKLVQALTQGFTQTFGSSTVTSY